jgi:formate hydrogenlyase subunit 6/NADH:ubiquinone oxidoreductase subunit I
VCIRCYCCHELCPHDAIDLYKPLLGRLVASK